MRVTRLISLVATGCLLFVGCKAQPQAGKDVRPPKEFEAEMEALTALSDDELFEIGLTSCDAGWSIAWSTDSEADAVAIEEALDPMGIGASGSCGHGRCGWYVEPEDFFVAQRALKESSRVQELGIKIVEPRLPFRESTPAEQDAAQNPVKR